MVTMFPISNGVELTEQYNLVDEANIYHLFLLEEEPDGVNINR
jgi:hypothetical protein